MQVLFIVRGLPGSGKTTLGNLIADVCFAADDYFYQIGGGKYAFDASKLKHAHAHCFNRVGAAMLAGIEKVAVTNTFTQEWEFKQYIELAEAHGYMVHVMIAENRHGNESVHNVPAEAVDRMRERFAIKL